MRPDARLIAVVVLLFAAALLVGQGGGLNLPAGAILLTTRAPCPWGTTEYRRADGRFLLPVSSGRGGFSAATIAPATADIVGAGRGLPAESSGLATGALSPATSPGFGRHTFLTTGHTVNLNAAPSIRVLACVVD